MGGKNLTGKKMIPSKGSVQLFSAVPRNVSASWGLLFIRAVLKQASSAASLCPSLNFMRKSLYSTFNDYVPRDAGVFQAEYFNFMSCTVPSTEK